MLRFIRGNYSTDAVESQRKLSVNPAPVSPASPCFREKSAAGRNARPPPRLSAGMPAALKECLPETASKLAAMGNPLPWLWRSHPEPPCKESGRQRGRLSQNKIAPPAGKTMLTRQRPGSPADSYLFRLVSIRGIQRWKSRAKARTYANPKARQRWTLISLSVLLS